MTCLCPHCGFDHAEEFPGELPYDDNADPEFGCFSCGETFFIKTHISVSWKTFETEDEYDLA